MTEPVDVSKKHFYISLIKSTLRLVGLGCWIALGILAQMPLLLAGGVLMFIAEIFGVIEEI